LNAAENEDRKRGRQEEAENGQFTDPQDLVGFDVFFKESGYFVPLFQNRIFYVQSPGTLLYMIFPLMQLFGYISFFSFSL